MSNCKYGCLHPWGFGLALGIFWAVVLFVMAFVVDFSSGYGLGFVRGVGSIYIGYHAGAIGGLIGAFWGFIDAFVGGVLFAWIYNSFCRGFGSCHDSSCSCEQKAAE